MERSAGAASLFAIARAVAADLGHALGEGGTGGGSDGNLTAALGVPTLDGLGAVGGGAHAADEHVSVGRTCPGAPRCWPGCCAGFSRSKLVRDGLLQDTNMGNTIKTALLLGLMSGVLLVLGDLPGRIRAA